MKPISFSFLFLFLIAYIAAYISSSLDTLAAIWTKARRQHLPVWILLGLCLNLAIAPAVFAMTNDTIDRGTAYAIGILGLVTLGLAIYLFVVIFQPERF